MDACLAAAGCRQGGEQAGCWQGSEKAEGAAPLSLTPSRTVAPHPATCRMPLPLPET